MVLDRLTVRSEAFLIVILFHSCFPTFAKQCKEAIWFYKQKLSYQEIALNDLNFPKAEGEVTADFLVQTGVDASHDNDAFKTKMMKAIKELMGQIQAALEKGEDITVDDIKRWMGYMALVRKELASDMKEKDANLYGLSSSKLGDEGFTVDAVRNEESDVHYYVFKKIKEFYEQNNGGTFDFARRSVKIEFKGKQYYIFLSVIAKENENLYFVIHHPNQENIELAFEMFADILNNRKLYAENLETLNLRLTQAVFILMHHTPWQRGTPSIVESTVEAVLRTAYGIAHPSKKMLENFWEAMTGTPTKTTKDPPKNKKWGFFERFFRKFRRPQKPVVFEYGSGWGRSSQ